MTYPTSPRLSFRSWTKDDVALALTLWGDPRVTALIDARGALGRDDVLAKLAAELASERDHRVQYWPAFLRSSGAFVGCAGLRVRDLATRTFELGCHLVPAFWGNGLATEAARAVMAHAFSALQVAALFAGHHPKNDASRALLSKLGFRHTHDELYPATGLLHPSYLLLADDYRGV
jgi:[ribosomal protein S5]-alanine N-acetyltransferase